LNILVVSAEVAPFAKVGGLADVVGSLPKELRRNGHDVRVVMPLYAMIESDPRWKLETVAKKAPVVLNGDWLEYATIKRTEIEGVPIYFVGHDRFFQSATSSAGIYTPGIEQYLFFSAAVLELPHLFSWTPDVIHCNDWHTGFVPVLMREKHAARFDSTGAVFTIHNLAYQGEFGVEILDALALPRSLFVPEYLETWGGVNFLKAGCVYSDQVNTVSPTYAKEIQTPEFGCKLEGLMLHLAELGRLDGILNGIDTDLFNPAMDPYIAAHYDMAGLKGKKACRDSLLRETGLEPIPGAPLVGAVTRLSHQKGLDLLAEAAPKLFELPVQLIIQGLGDPAIIARFRRLESEYPKNIRYFEKFDEDLAQRIYAGSDVFAMPSLFEPCGLGQMIAMRYGAVPLVRSVGGLADTVTEGVNGFTFSDASQEDLVAAFARAVLAYRNPRSWQALLRRGMRSDFSWQRSANDYACLYERAIEARAGDILKLA
jgi:starch synthase